ncbi:MAG: peptidyl-prolyl cis-trans isomerase [Ottowia sp.]|nr:peptidyl-prolyl cis-trans isomerase [Ottowia sp.]
MAITVNGVALGEAEIAQELPRHQDAENPRREAEIACILRRLMLAEAARLGISGGDEEETIARLLDSQAAAPEPDEAACRRFYDANPARFTVGECVEAAHILFQPVDGQGMPALIEFAKQTLERLQKQPEHFADMARELSDCPSGAMGGELGEIRRGDTVPEFEHAVFAAKEGGIHPNLIHTRHGLHIVRVARHVPGRVLDFEQVADGIAQALRAMGRDTAWRHYAGALVARADITGIDLRGNLAAGNMLGAEQGDARAPS